MLNIMLSGCCGSMGRAVTAFVDNRDDIKITAGIDREGRECKFPTFVSPFSFNGKVDVIIDFSSPAALPGLLEYAVSAKTPTVIATTGLSEAHTALIYKAAKEIPIFFSANMSLGINLLCELAKTAARVLGGTYDIEIVETHHAQKTDAPSGTAVGEHEIIFAGYNETIKLSHCAQSKELFAAGAVNAAKFIQNKEPGLYGMSDMIDRKDAKK